MRSDILQFPEKTTVIFDEMFQVHRRAGLSDEDVSYLKNHAQGLVDLEAKVSKFEDLFMGDDGVELESFELNLAAEILENIRNFNAEFSKLSFNGDLSAYRTNFNRLLEQYFYRSVEAGGRRLRYVDYLIISLDQILQKYNFKSQLKFLESTKDIGVLTAAIESAKQWVRSQEELGETSKARRITDLLEKAEEHSWKKRRYWLFAAGFLSVILVSGLLIVVLSDLALASAKMIPIAVASSVVFYAFWYCLSQYGTEQQLYEAYKFRALILNLSNGLITAYTKHEEELFKHMIDSVYSDPSVQIFSNNKSKINTDLVKFVGDVLKSRGLDLNK